MIIVCVILVVVVDDDEDDVSLISPVNLQWLSYGLFLLLLFLVMMSL